MIVTGTGQPVRVLATQSSKIRVEFYCTEQEVRLMNDGDVIERAVDLYSKGWVNRAMGCLFPSPFVCYDDIVQASEAEEAWVNLGDAYSRGTVVEAASAALHLQTLLREQQPPWASSAFIEQLGKDCALLSYRAWGLPFLANAHDPQAVATERRRLSQQLNDGLLRCLLAEEEGRILDTTEINALANSFVGHDRVACIQQLDHSQQLVRFIGSRRSLWNKFQAAIPTLSRPHQAYAFSAPDGLFDHLKHQVALAPGIPVLLMEAYDLDWNALLQPLSDKPAVFLFSDVSVLMQCLQFSAITEAILNRQHVSLVLNLYPNSQFRCQQNAGSTGAPYTLIPVTTDESPTKWHQPLLRLLSMCLSQERNALRGDSGPGDALYHLGKTLWNSTRSQQLGVRRSAAFRRRCEHLSWYDKHKGQPQSKLRIDIPSSDHYGTLLANQKPLTKRRPPASDGKCKLTHVVPQLVDQGHAPTKLLRSILEHHNRDRFDVSVIVTERFQHRGSEYPYDSIESLPSSQRAPKLLDELLHAEIPVHLAATNRNFLQTAHTLATMLSNSAVDIAIFHGPDEINHLVANTCDVPRRVLFEHGTLPEHAGFDLVIASSIDSATIHRTRLKTLATDIVGLPFVVDARRQWSQDCTSLAVYGIPAEAQVLTTVSNNLEARLTDDMCWTVAEILKRFPQAYYAPIGHIEDIEALRQRFRRYDVDDRVVFIGRHPKPSQLCRNMTLYLNEFPFGSCLGMLDAMAAGCPPISMYDPDGPPQARYAGSYFGIDRCIVSGKKEDYAMLACQVLDNPKMYEEWSQHAMKQYETHCDIQDYVRKIERYASAWESISSERQASCPSEASS